MDATIQPSFRYGSRLILMAERFKARAVRKEASGLQLGVFEGDRLDVPVSPSLVKSFDREWSNFIRKGFKIEKLMVMKFTA